jgi:TPR repeat protein
MKNLSILFTASIKNASLILIWVPLISAALPQPVLAAEKCDLLMTGDQSKNRGIHFKKLLTDKQFAALEDELGSRQSTLKDHGYSDELLHQDLHAAFDSDPSIEPLLSEWIGIYPKSFVARMARASHYVASGYSKRGYEFSDKTSQEQYDAMQLQFEKAAADLNQALPLSKVPSLAYAERISIARAISGRDIVAHLIEDAYQKFPGSLAVKVEAARALNPKWAGSFEALDQLAVSAQSGKMDSSAIRVVKYRVEMEKANYYDVGTRQMARAAEHYILAGNQCESTEPWKNGMRVTYEIEDWPGVITMANRMLEVQPADIRALEKRGYAFEKMDKMPDASKDYGMAAALGSSWSQNKLGYWLWQGKNVPKDLPRAKLLLEQAAEQGNKNARTNLNGLNAELKGK